MSAVLSDLAGTQNDCYGLFYADVPHVLRTSGVDVREVSLANRRNNWTSAVRESLNRMSCLQDNWDGYDASSIDYSVLLAVADVISSIMLPETPPPTLIPTSNGSVQAEWHMRDLEIEVEIFSSTRIEFYMKDFRSGEEEEKELSIDFSTLVRAINKLTNRIG